MPGIDLMGAAMLLVEIGSDMSVFGSAQRLASWVGMCPGNNEPAGKRKSGGIRKGNAWVRRLLCEFAQAAGRSRCVLKDKFLALNVRKGHKRSIVALGHKMLRTIYAMLSKKNALRGQTRGLRGVDGRSKCAPMVANAGQARIRSSARLI